MKTIKFLKQIIGKSNFKLYKVRKTTMKKIITKTSLALLSTIFAINSATTLTHAMQLNPLCDTIISTDSIQLNLSCHTPTTPGEPPVLHLPKRQLIENDGFNLGFNEFSIPDFDEELIIGFDANNDPIFLEHPLADFAQQEIFLPIAE